MDPPASTPSSPPAGAAVSAAPPAAPATAPAEHHAFVRELEALVTKYDRQGVRLGALLERTEGRGYYLVLILIALPFVGPIPLPGFSIPFGLAIALIGLRLTWGRGTWLPRYFLEWEISPGLLSRVVRGTGRTLKAVEVVLRPRLVFMQDGLAFRRIGGAMILVCGLFMVLPLPLPFSNSLPAWTVLFLAIGALERDGVFFILGAVAFGVTTAFFTFLAVGGVEAVEKLRQLWWRSG